MKKTLLALSFLFASSLSLGLDVPSIGDSLGISPFAHYKVLFTEHFRITYPEELKAQAYQAATYYEEANTTLSKALLWEVRTRVSVLLLDSADAANGLTTPIQRFGMVLYITPPDNFFSTNYYDDWFRLLIFHEYVHFLNMDATRGIYEPIRILLGDLILPNSFWPSWMLEGLAVYYETRLTQAGRGRSPYYEMVLRSAAEKNLLGKKEWVDLGRIHSNNPYYPGGETAYLFGYQMMNEIVQKAPKTETYDQGDALDTPEDVLGVMSFRSSRRIPYFVNGNLENLIGKDWYTLWSDWVSETDARMKTQLSKIKQAPVSTFKSLTPGAYQVLGSAYSPNGDWLAYHVETMDEPASIQLKNLKTGKSENIFEEQVMGSTVRFTPDSKHVVFSSLRRSSNYGLWSELIDYSLEKKDWFALTSHARARDPDVSSDGNSITFTQTKDSTTYLSRARLTSQGGRLALGEIEKLWSGPRYSRVSTPRFSSDGSRIVFSYHENGKVGEEIAVLSLSDRKLETLVSNLKMNRNPVFSQNGDLYFISDLTGVDNLYLYQKGERPIQKTNTTTGVALPTFNGVSPNLVTVSNFTPTGWELAETSLFEKVDSTQVTIDPPPGPVTDSLSVSKASTLTNVAESDYSIWPSILPRQWAPVLFLAPGETYMGGEIMGFDTVDRHRYLFFGAYDSLLKNADWIGLYSNRSFGVNLSAFASEQNLNVDVKHFFTRKMTFNLTAKYPFQFTASSVTPFASVQGERETEYDRSSGANVSVWRSRYVPSADLGVIYSDQRGSRLGLAPEDGRQTTLSGRKYTDNEVSSLKAFAQDIRYLRAFDHVAVTSNIRASATSKTSRRYLDSNVVIQGRHSTLFNPFDPDNLDQMSLRGYPNETFFTKSAAVGSLDFKIPVSRIFEGWGTNPVSLQNLYGVAFFETAYFPRNFYNDLFLPSAGGGLRLSSEFFFRVPLTFALEYHSGMRSDYGGLGEVFFSLNLDPIQF